MVILGLIIYCYYYYYYYYYIHVHTVGMDGVCLCVGEFFAVLGGGCSARGIIPRMSLKRHLEMAQRDFVQTGTY